MSACDLLGSFTSLLGASPACSPGSSSPLGAKSRIIAWAFCATSCTTSMLHTMIRLPIASVQRVASFRNSLIKRPMVTDGAGRSPGRLVSGGESRAAIRAMMFGVPA
jgi:hypothetical protein